MVDCLVTSTLTKVLPGRRPEPLATPVVVWPDRPLRLQLAWLPSPTALSAPDPVRLAVEVDAPCTPTAFRVGLVPATVPHWPHDEGPYLVDEPSLLPDPLLPLELELDHGEGRTTASAELNPRHVGWNAVWVEIPANQARLARRVQCRIEAADKSVEAELGLVQLDERAWDALQGDPDDFDFLQWLHPDAVALQHGVEVWGEEHWALLRDHLASARDMGVTSAFVPVWTPPLDTAEGTYRTNVQLLRIIDDGGYRFDAERLDRYLGLCVELGYTAIELPHLFTQWGARATPQVWVDGTSGPERRFGWDVAATDPSWRTLLERLVPWLREHLETNWHGLRRYWHVSDEPAEYCRDSYRDATEVVRDLLEGEVIVDALSEPQFAELVQVPIVATNHVDGFRAAGLETPWVYHCTVQTNGVANRYLAQDGVRTRMLGAQLFAQRAQGFLHWGFNFWLAQFALGTIDPWAETSAGGGFVSGDPFVVYPREGGLVESQRHRLVGDAMRDRQLFVRAAEALGRDEVLRILNPAEAIDYNSGWLDNATFEVRLVELARALGTR